MIPAAAFIAFVAAVMACGFALGRSYEQKRAERIEEARAIEYRATFFNRLMRVSSNG